MPRASRSRRPTEWPALSDVVHRVQDLIDNRFTDRLPLADLASVSQVSERMLTRLFTASTGVTPLRYQQLLHVQRGEQAAAHAVGFEDARMLRRPRAELDE